MESPALKRKKTVTWADGEPLSSPTQSSDAGGGERAGGGDDGAASSNGAMDLLLGPAPARELLHQQGESLGGGGGGARGVQRPRPGAAASLEGARALPHSFPPSPPKNLLPQTTPYSRPSWRHSLTHRAAPRCRARRCFGGAWLLWRRFSVLMRGSCGGL